MTKYELTVRPTQEHWQQLNRLSREWITQSRNTDRPDRLQTETAIGELYDWLRLERPTIVWCQNPWQLLVMPGILSCILRSEELSAKLPELTESAPSQWLALWRQLQSQSDTISQKVKNWPLVELFEPIKDPDTGNLQRTSKDFFRALRVADFFVDLSPQLTLRYEDFILQLSSGCYLNLTTSCFDAIKTGCLDPFSREGGSLSRRQIHSDLNRTLNWQRLVDELQPHTTPQTQTEFAPSWQRGPVDSYLVSPWHEADQLLKASLNNVWWGSWTSNWLPVYQFLFSTFDLPSADAETLRELNCWLELARQATAYVFFKRICFVCTRPTSLSSDEHGRAHNETQAAVEFPDEYKLFSWHGTTVPERVITCPEQITIKAIENMHNIEVRRVMIERFGGGRFITESGAKKIHEDEFGTLYCKSIPQDEPLVMVKVLNKTAEPDGSFREYFLRVPPTMTKARDAVAWTFAMKASEYSPNLET
jgi:hypothetical protein